MDLNTNIQFIILIISAFYKSEATRIHTRIGINKFTNTPTTRNLVQETQTFDDLVVHFIVSSQINKIMAEKKSN